jgi:hypothetical protein
LALIATAPHRDSWFHTDPDALFGVSAATGGYRFIDLPSADTGGELDPPPGVLSPDGTKIGYWLLGTIATAHSQNDVGFAVYDSVTGSVERHLVPSRFGIDPQWLVWSADSSHLVADWTAWIRGGSRSGGGTSHARAAVSWNLASGETRRIGSLFSLWAPFSDGVGIHGFTGVHSGLTIDPVTGSRQTWSVTGDLGDGAMFPTVNEATRLLALEDDVPGLKNQSDRWCVFVGTPSAEDSSIWRARLVDIQAPQTDLVGWVDATHLLVRVWSSSRSSFMSRYRLELLDVTNRHLEVVGPPQGRRDPLASYADDLIVRPFVPGIRPPSVRDPRLIPGLAGGVVVAVLLGGLVVMLVRRGRGGRFDPRLPKP